MAVALGDVDGDGDLDAFVANSNQANRVWLNDGSGTFTDSGQSLGDSSSWAVALGDLDGDGDLDAFVGELDGQANRGVAERWQWQLHRQRPEPGEFRQPSAWPWATWTATATWTPSSAN